MKSGLGVVVLVWLCWCGRGCVGVGGVTSVCLVFINNTKSSFSNQSTTNPSQQENVLRFVNLVGHVVHSNTEWFEGSPNKNIGDAFLLVWKMSKMCQRRINASKKNKKIVMTNAMRRTSHAALVAAGAAGTTEGQTVELLEPIVIGPSTRKRGDQGTRHNIAPSLTENMPTSTANLFPDFVSPRDESTAITLADGCLKAMVQTAYDLHHLNTLNTDALLDQVTSATSSTTKVQTTTHRTKVEWRENVVAKLRVE